MFAACTGQRLGDIASVTWANVNLAGKEKTVTVFARKTRTLRTFPLYGKLLACIGELPAGDEPNAPLFPKSADVLSRTKRKSVSLLSRQFREILVAAGLAKPYENKPHCKQSEDEKRKRKHKINEISFHSFRHTARSYLINAGVLSEVVNALIGWESDKVGKKYTHIKQDVLREAAQKLSTVGDS